jgi:hypothetical protein
MKTLIVALTFAAGCAFAQTSAPVLAEIKIAADAGDPAAQDKLAEKFLARSDVAQAELWYRKAAEQGFAHPQGRLGSILLKRSRSSGNMNPEDRDVVRADAVKWITLAANQGDKRGQADFADICLEGKLVKQDLVEAYKWGELAAQGPKNDSATRGGRSTRDGATLKMNAAQIAEARRRVAAFVPHQVKPSEIPAVPDPAWVKQIKLNGISGAGARRLAIINNQTFQRGDELKVKIAEKSVKVRCVEVKESSVLITIEGLEGERELKLTLQ